MRAWCALTPVSSRAKPVSMLEVTFARRLAVGLAGPVLGVALFAGASNSNNTTLATAAVTPGVTQVATAQPSTDLAEFATPNPLVDVHADDVHLAQDHPEQDHTVETADDVTLGPAVVVERG